MQILSLIYPMAALVFLTFFMMYMLWILRVKAARSHKISPGYFKLNKGGELADNVTAVTQNYNLYKSVNVPDYQVHLTESMWIFIEKIPTKTSLSRR